MVGPLISFVQFPYQSANGSLVGYSTVIVEQHSINAHYANRLRDRTSRDRRSNLKACFPQIFSLPGSCATVSASPGRATAFALHGARHSTARSSATQIFISTICAAPL